MTPVEPLIGESRPGLAIGGGILAGVLTLALVTVALTVFGGADAQTAGGSRPAPGETVAPVLLGVGDCIDHGAGAGAAVIYRSCTADHRSQVTARLPLPQADGDYPGADQLGLWVGQQCNRQADTYLDTPLLATTLDAGAILPGFEDWSDGDTMATCYVSRLDGGPLSASVQGLGSTLPRSSQIPVSRLMIGDCFAPAGGLGSYELNSNSQVDLVACDGSYNGIFFGRGTLDSPVSGAAFPGDVEIGEATSDRCAGLFRDAFGQSADGFNYRYWRPNQQSWDLGDREILCAVLDAEPLAGSFDPAAFESFFDLETGTCFQLGPEERSSTLGLDDRVRPGDCDASHAGQMIGSGLLSDAEDAPYPGEDELKAAAGAECERLFEAFVGISPFESELVNFPFWYPNDSGWEQGDRRYACAFVDDAERVGSLEDAGI